MEDNFNKRDLRKVEIKVDGVGWTPCKFGDVVKGDVFRLFEATGEPVVLPDGQDVFESAENAFFEHGKWCLTTKDED
jgi:hypothetical protein